MDRGGQSLRAGGAELLVLEPRVWLVIGVIEVPLAAIDLAKRFKDMHRVSKHDLVHAHPLVCPACCWIIGYGHLCDSMHLPITEGEADA